jgi:hypothetical protein
MQFSTIFEGLQLMKKVGVNRYESRVPFKKNEQIKNDE